MNCVPPLRRSVPRWRARCRNRPPANARPRADVTRGGAPPVGFASGRLRFRAPGVSQTVRPSYFYWVRLSWRDLMLTDRMSRPGARPETPPLTEPRPANGRPSHSIGIHVPDLSWAFIGAGTNSVRRRSALGESPTCACPPRRCGQPFRAAAGGGRPAPLATEDRC
jgi:hypothetical protein